MNYDDYVCGTKFQSMADWQITDNGQVRQNILYLVEPPFWVLYSHTHNYKYAIDVINKYAPAKFVLITHNSDGGVQANAEKTGQHDANASLLPPNVIKWYAQNVFVKDDRIVELPIGLENAYCFPYDKAKILFNMKEEYKDLVPAKELYLNCNINTYPHERGHLYELCQGRKDTTIKYSANGDDYEIYILDILEHKMVLCPRGNGLDTHRVWETLYLGRCPIVIGGSAWEGDKQFDLPILRFPTWHHALAYYPRMYKANQMISSGFEYNTLSMKYWEKRIKNAE